MENDATEALETPGPLAHSGAPAEAQSLRFSAPVKRIFDSQTTAYFQRSTALHRLKHYIHLFARTMAGVPCVAASCSQDREMYTPDHPVVTGVVSLLRELAALKQETPPLAGPRRYGNLACRTWHDKVDRKLAQLLLAIPGIIKDREGMLDELHYYIANAFGSKVRLDYGTGHELSFLAFLACLDMRSLLAGMHPRDLVYLWEQYYDLVKSLIVDYNLEPAGSHGVWGLDDHFHLIYIWGASQFLPDTSLQGSASFHWPNPRDLLLRQEYRTYRNSNFLCHAIDFILTVKTGPFHEHSPILYDILTQVKTWAKVQRGLLRMYDDEVLNKFPVVQHFWFGMGFFPWTDARTGQPLPVFEEQHQHQQNVHHDHTQSIQSMATTTMPLHNVNVHHKPQPSTSTAASRLMQPPSTRSINSLLARDSRPRR